MHTSLSEDHRIIAIGDIHGCILTLKALVRNINPRSDDQFIFLGDFIDRGKSSKRGSRLPHRTQPKVQLPFHQGQPRTDAA